MKTLLLSTAFIAATILPGFSETKDPGGFVGIVWGTSAKETIDIMAKRPWVKLCRPENSQDPQAQRPERTTDGYVTFEGGRFEGLAAAGWNFEIRGGKMIAGTVEFSIAETHADNLRDQFNEALTKKYGPGQTVTRQHGNGDVQTSIITRWKIGETSITCSSTLYAVTISYAQMPILQQSDDSDL